MTIISRVLRGFSKSTMFARGPFVFTGLVLLLTPAVHAGGVVGTCNESSLAAAIAGGGTVTFACSGTITLSSTISFVSDTTIDGMGRSVTITNFGGRTFSVFAGVGVNLFNLTLANAGASAIRNAGSLDVTNCNFYGNQIDKDISTGGGGGGGAIDNRGQLQVKNSSFSNNKSRFGGSAIYNSPAGFAGVMSSTFFANTVLGDSLVFRGGGIYNDGGTLFVTNSTFQLNGSNNAQGGNIYNSGWALVRHSTLRDGIAAVPQGGNIYGAPLIDTPTIVVNTILSHPIAGGNCGGFIFNGGGNLQDGTLPLCFAGSIGDPKLDSLRFNGGPTQTMALLPGSAAIDGVLNPFSCTPTDQRGVLRPQGPRCDIGAYEVIPNTTGVVGELVSLLMNFEPNLPKTGAGKLTQQVIEPLSHSLAPAFWRGTDGNHLDPQRGKQVFDLHQTVISNLSELIVDQTQLDYINNLLLADRRLAVTAMGDGGCPVSSPAAPTNGKCGQAASELAKGDSSSALGNYGDAVDHYGAAWEAAVAGSSHE